MRRLWVALLAHSALAGTLAGTLAAGELIIEEVDTAQFPTVQCRVASDVAGLPPSPDASLFRVTEDGERVADLTVEADRTPVALVLVLECSSSVARDLPAMRRFCLGLAGALPADGLCMVVPFAGQVLPLVAATSDLKQLARALDALAPSGGSALLDALQAALDEVSVRARTHRGVVVCLTQGRDVSADGKSRASETRAKEVVLLARALGAPMHMVGVSAGARQEALARLAQAASGTSRMLPPGSDPGVDQGLIRLLRRAILLRYPTPRAVADGSRRRVTVASDRAGSKNVEAAYQAPMDPQLASGSQVPAATEGPPDTSGPSRPTDPASGTTPTDASKVPDPVRQLAPVRLDRTLAPDASQAIDRIEKRVNERLSGIARRESMQVVLLLGGARAKGGKDAAAADKLRGDASRRLAEAARELDRAIQLNQDQAIDDLTRAGVSGAVSQRLLSDLRAKQEKAIDEFRGFSRQAGAGLPAPSVVRTESSGASAASAAGGPGQGPGRPGTIGGMPTDGQEALRLLKSLAGDTDQKQAEVRRRLLQDTLPASGGGSSRDRWRPPTR